MYASNGYIEKDGITLVESMTIELSQATSNNEVETLLGGFTGHTSGTKKYTIAITNPVPAAGFEMNWMEICEASEEHQLRFVILRPAEAGGGVLWEKLLAGDFRDPKVTVDVNKPVSTTVTFHGRAVT